MAFTGTATVKLVADNMVRITGLSLAAGAQGTISFAAGSGQVKLPANVEYMAYKVSDGTTVQASDSVDVGSKLADSTFGAVAPIAITKVGVGATDFLATLTNQSLASATGQLEIYVKFHT